MADSSPKRDLVSPSVSPVSATITQADAASAYDATLHSDASFASAPALSAGTRIGDRYVLEEHISSGGFGAVYCAADEQIRSHRVALKLLHAPAADEQARESALRELTLLASISHPSVVQFKDYGWYQGRLWFAMPWYRGETLAQRYGSAVGQLSLTRKVARPIFERAALGLAALHEVGISHCDIKPENIFVAEVAGFDEGLPVLLDLGIASTRGEGPKGLTLEYAAPEQAAVVLGDKTASIGPAADVFALALVLRNLLEPQTVSRPKTAALAQLQERAITPIAAPSGREFRHLQAAFARWLSIDLAQRPSATEFARELAALTAPDERRAARMRLLRRLGPLAALIALLVAFLTSQVRKEARELRYEKSLLDAQRKTTDELRVQSLEQLRALEAESKGAPENNSSLRRATLNARQFKALFERSEQRAATLERKLNGERENATQQRARTQAQIDALNAALHSARAQSEGVAPREAAPRTRARGTAR